MTSATATPVMWAGFLLLTLWSGCLVLSEASPCDDGFELYRGQTEDTCIKVHNKRRMSRWVAGHECYKERSHLVEILDAGLNQFIQDRLSRKRRYWMGGIKYYAWEYYTFFFQAVAQEDDLPFQNWAKNKPGPQEDSHDCIQINGKNGLWSNKKCCARHYFVCQHPTDGEQNTFPWG